MIANQQHLSQLTLPRQLTAFVGRTDELTQIHNLLLDPNCRLLTLVGAGGMGKTRLALEAAATLPPQFSDGVVLVALGDATTELAMVTAMTHALHCPLAGSHDARTQLLNFLADKRVLLVLDNLEHLLDHVELLATLLAAAPSVKVLATSREMLNLTDEWLFAVNGLPVPDEQVVARGEPTELAKYDSVHLFAERARRVRRNFAPEVESNEIAHICQLVDGMPLAIELAAAWLKTLTCAEVANEIQQSLDFLTTSQRDVAPRHRSMRAVCAHSWQRLSVREQSVLRALAIFHSGFQRRAAREVAGATLSILASLVEKSLLRWEPDTRRYQMHRLLRQYALEQLMQAPNAHHHTKARHCAYYVAFLRAQGEAILSGEQRAAIQAIEIELNNVRLAWQWAVTDAALDDANTEDLITLARTLIDYYQIRSRYLEGAEAITQAIERLRHVSTSPAITPSLALLLTYQGSLYIRLGRIDEAQTILQDAYSFYLQTDSPPTPGYNTDPAFSLGIIALIQGNYHDAMRLGEQVRQSSERHDHRQNALLAHYLLATATLAQGELTRARHHAKTACAIAHATASHWFMAYCLNELGNIAFALGDYSTARIHYAESYTIRQAFDDPEGMALALVRLGESALAQENYADARTLFQEGQMLYHQIGDAGGLTAAFTGQGRAAVGLQEWKGARDYLHQALTLALDIHYLPYLGSIFYGTALFLIATGEATQGVALLATIAHHPTTPHVLVDQLQRHLGSNLSYLAPDFLVATNQLGAAVDLEGIARALLETLSQPPATLAATPSSPPLVESLSERELELLRFLAAGLKNREIAAQMVISVNTVKVHINNIYGKLGVSNRIQAVARAQELALL